jgi:hypothetical protein
MNSLNFINLFILYRFIFKPQMEMQPFPQLPAFSKSNLRAITLAKAYDLVAIATFLQPRGLPLINN